MSLSTLCAVCAVATLVSSAAFSQPATPSVVGKTCRGTFQVRDPVSGQTAVGGFQFRFGGTQAKPTAHIWRGFGQTVWQKLEREVDSGTLTNDLTGLDDIGEAQNLQIQNNQVTFKTRQGSGIILMYDATAPQIYDGTALISTQTSGEPSGRLDWRSANAHILCR
jgi:hypothetical protein